MSGFSVCPKFHQPQKGKFVEGIAFTHLL